MDLKTVAVWAVTFLLVVGVLSVTIGRDIINQKQPTLTSFSVIHFSGYLFFLVLPVEILVPYYLSEGYLAIILIFLALVTAVVAQIIDYSLGFLVSEKVIHNLIGSWRYRKYERVIKKYGAIAILVFNLFPLSSPILSLIAGMLRYDFKRFFLFSVSGLVIKYTLLAYGFSLFL
ncbi:MAG: VTT domain-containing protein [Nanoarchaeota archaeon]|nr:VTT domain-containing protein [Nanoarchaeota archaeon]MBU1855340.1 VTT domain-containing protein [Nanoarchaeota archaeon]